MPVYELWELRGFTVYLLNARHVKNVLARLIYTMLTKRTAYVGKGQAYYEERYRERVIRNLNKKAADMGFIITHYAGAGKDY